MRRTGAAMSTSRRAPGDGTLVSSALGMMSGKAVGMVFGFAFWLAAARIAPADVVGIAAGATSSIMFVSLLASAGVGAAAIVHYHRADHQAKAVVDTSLTLAALLAGAIALAALAVAGGVLSELRAIAVDPLFAGTFGAMCVIGTLGVVLDQISMAQRRGRDLIVRNGTNGALTLLIPGLIWFGALQPSARTLFAGWVLGSAAALAVGWRQLHVALEGHVPRPRLDTTITRRLLATSASNQLLTTAERAPGLLLPVVVTEVLTPTDNAYWYTAWMIAWGVVVVPMSTATALFAETSRPKSNPARHLRSAIRSSLAISTGLAAIVVILAPLVLRIAGRDYATNGTTTLRVLVLAVIPLSFTYPYLALARSSGRITRAIVTATIGGAGGLAVGAWAGDRWGLAGLAVGWLAVQTAVGAWAAVTMRSMLADLAASDRGEPTGAAEHHGAITEGRATTPATTIVPEAGPPAAWQ